MVGPSRDEVIHTGETIETYGLPMGGSDIDSDDNDEVAPAAKAAAGQLDPTGLGWGCALSFCGGR